MLRTAANSGRKDRREVHFAPSLQVLRFQRRFTIWQRLVSGSNSAVECQLPKLEVAGSIPVSRSIFSMLRTKRFHSVVRLGSEYITCRSFSPCKILVTLRSINALAEREIARPNHLSVSSP